MRRLTAEFQCLRKRNFELHFRYPTPEERRHLKIVHRDMTTEERKRIEAQEKGLVSLIKDLEAGKVHPEDLGESLIKKLSELLKKKE